MRTENKTPTGDRNGSGDAAETQPATARDNQREGTPPGPRAPRRSATTATGNTRSADPTTGARGTRASTSRTRSEKRNAQDQGHEACAADARNQAPGQHRRCARDTGRAPRAKPPEATGEASRRHVRRTRKPARQGAPIKRREHANGTPRSRQWPSPTQAPGTPGPERNAKSRGSNDAKRGPRPKRRSVSAATPSARAPTRGRALPDNAGAIARRTAERPPADDGQRVGPRSR